MPLLDEEGNLFGLVNVVDFGAVVLVLLLVVGAFGAYTVVTAGDDEPEPMLFQQVVVESTNVSNETIDGVSAGFVDMDGVVLIENVEVRAGNNTKDLRMAVRLRVEQRDGLVYFNGTRLYIGRKLPLDLGRVSVEATVVEAFEPIERFSTPTPGDG